MQELHAFQASEIKMILMTEDDTFKSNQISKTDVINLHRVTLHGACYPYWINIGIIAQNKET